MKKIIPFLLLLFLGCAPAKDDDPIIGRWAFTEADNPDLERVVSDYEETYNVDGFKQVFAASKLILRSGQTFDLCLFQNYRHGRWKVTAGKLVLWTEPSDVPLFFTIDTLTGKSMRLSIDSSNFRNLGRFVMPYKNMAFFRDRDKLRFELAAEKDVYADESSDPYSKENNQWRIRPLAPETPGQLKKKVMKLVDFHLLMFSDAIENDKKVITYNWFSSPLVVARNGLALRGYKKIKEDWEEYFYDSTQAMQAFNILRTGFDKKMHFPEEIENPFKRNLQLLKQYRKNLE